MMHFDLEELHVIVLLRFSCGGDDEARGRPAIHR